MQWDKPEDERRTSSKVDHNAENDQANDSDNLDGGENEFCFSVGA